MEVDKRNISRKERNLCLSLLEENHDSGTMIEAWNHIPDDLLEIILTRLPVVVLFRFRLVCKRWNSIITTCINFQQCWGEVAPTKQSWFFVKDGGIGSGTLYDPFTKKWRHAPPMPLPAPSITFPLTFFGGLVCYLNIMQTAFFVGNPLNQSWRVQSCTESAIIKMEARGFISIGMVTVSDRDIFTSPWRSKIVLLGNNGNFEVFTNLNDFSLESPMITGLMQSHIKVSSYLSRNAVNVCMNLLFLGSRRHGIIVYNVVNGQWMQLLIPRPFNSSDLALIESNDRLLPTGLVKDHNTSNISVRVWKLDSKVMRMWMEIDRISSSLFSEFDGKATSYKCLCNKNVIVIMLKTSRMSRLFTYDVASHEWSKVPKLKVPRQKRTSGVTGIGFFPGFGIAVCVCSCMHGHYLAEISKNSIQSYE